MDTSAKTIKLESNIKLLELVKNLEKLLPKGLWKDFTLETSTIINNWTSPVVIHQKSPWWDRPYLTTCDENPLKATYEVTCSNKTMALQEGTYNLEI
jgi:hypothetical protein